MTMVRGPGGRTRSRSGGGERRQAQRAKKIQEKRKSTPVYKHPTARELLDEYGETTSPDDNYSGSGGSSGDSGSSGFIVDRKDVPVIPKDPGEYPTAPGGKFDSEETGKNVKLTPPGGDYGDTKFTRPEMESASQTARRREAELHARAFERQYYRSHPGAAKGSYSPARMTVSSEAFKGREIVVAGVKDRMAGDVLPNKEDVVKSAFTQDVGFQYKGVYYYGSAAAVKILNLERQGEFKVDVVDDQVKVTDLRSQEGVYSQPSESWEDHYSREIMGKSYAPGIPEKAPTLDEYIEMNKQEVPTSFTSSTPTTSSDRKVMKMGLIPSLDYLKSAVPKYETTPDSKVGKFLLWLGTKEIPFTGVKVGIPDEEFTLRADQREREALIKKYSGEEERQLALLGLVKSRQLDYLPAGYEGYSPEDIKTVERNVKDIREARYSLETDVADIKGYRTDVKKAHKKQLTAIGVTIGVTGGVLGVGMAGLALPAKISFAARYVGSLAVSQKTHKGIKAVIPGESLAEEVVAFGGSLATGIGVMGVTGALERKITSQLSPAKVFNVKGQVTAVEELPHGYKAAGMIIGKNVKVKDFYGTRAAGDITAAYKEVYRLGTGKGIGTFVYKGTSKGVFRIPITRSGGGIYAFKESTNVERISSKLTGSTRAIKETMKKGSVVQQTERLSSLRVYGKRVYNMMGKKLKVKEKIKGDMGQVTDTLGYESAPGKFKGVSFTRSAYVKPELYRASRLGHKGGIKGAIEGDVKIPQVGEGGLIVHSGKGLTGKITELGFGKSVFSYSKDLVTRYSPIRSGGRSIELSRFTTLVKDSSKASGGSVGGGGIVKDVSGGSGGSGLSGSPPSLNIQVSDIKSVPLGMVGETSKKAVTDVIVKGSHKAITREALGVSAAGLGVSSLTSHVKPPGVKGVQSAQKVVTREVARVSSLEGGITSRSSMGAATLSLSKSDVLRVEQPSLSTPSQVSSLVSSNLNKLKSSRSVPDLKNYVDTERIITPDVRTGQTQKSILDPDIIPINEAAPVSKVDLGRVPSPRIPDIPTPSGVFVPPVWGDPGAGSPRRPGRGGSWTKRMSNLLNIKSPDVVGREFTQDLDFGEKKKKRKKRRR